MMSIRNIVFLCILLQSPEYKETRRQRQEYTLKQANITRCAATHLRFGGEALIDRITSKTVLGTPPSAFVVLRLARGQSEP